MAMKLNGVNFSPEKGWEFSIEKICELIDGVIPPEIDKTLVLHNMYLNYIGNQSYQKERTILFYGKSSPTKMEKVVELMEKWNLIVVSERSIVNAEGKILPTIRVKDAVEAWCALGAYLKMSHPVPTIGITGSVGKTTTTKFAECVFNEKYKVFISGMNRNVASLAVRRMLKEYGSPYTFHVQETGGGDIKRVENMASFLNCDAFGITGIEANHHLDKYITTENMIADKTSFDRYGKEEQFCVLNGDDELLMQQTYRSKVYTYGIRNKNADYVGTNIVQNGKYLEFDVDDHETLTHIKIQIPGVHNVYNALMVFIFAKKFGLTDKQIQKGFLNYSSSGIRQNIKEVAGRTLYIDCFNVCSASILSCCDTLEQIRVEEGKKRIAVIGGENALGDISFDANFETGKLLQKYQNIDRFVFVGINGNRSKADLDYYGNGAAVYEGAKAAGMATEYSFCDDLNALADILRNETESGDVVLFKGLFRWPIFAAIDMAFGTSFLARNVNFKPKKANAIAIECEYYTEIGGSVLKQCSMCQKAQRHMITSSQMV